jgi:hypothetical protein
VVRGGRTACRNRRAASNRSRRRPPSGSRPSKVQRRATIWDPGEKLPWARTRPAESTTSATPSEPSPSPEATAPEKSQGWRRSTEASRPFFSRSRIIRKVLARLNARGLPVRRQSIVSSFQAAGSSTVRVEFRVREARSPLDSRLSRVGSATSLVEELGSLGYAWRCRTRSGIGPCGNGRAGSRVALELLAAQWKRSWKAPGGLRRDDVAGGVVDEGRPLLSRSARGRVGPRQWRARHARRSRGRIRASFVSEPVLDVVELTSPPPSRAAVNAGRCRGCLARVVQQRLDRDRAARR